MIFLSRNSYGKTPSGFPLMLTRDHDMRYPTTSLCRSPLSKILLFLTLSQFVSCELLVKLRLFSSLPPKLVTMSSPLPLSTQCCLDYPSSKYRCIFVSLRIPSSWGKGGGRALVVFSPYKCSQLGLFRVILCLCFKTSLRAKPFIWKWEWFAWKWTCRQTHFHTDSSARRLGLTLRQKTTRKWPIAIL